MASRVTSPSRLLAGVLVLVMAVVSSATCLAAALDADQSQQHACCAGMAENCGDGTMTAQEDCCAVQNSDLARFAASIGAAPLSTASTAVEPPSTSPPTGSTFHAGVPNPSNPPTYLLLAVFRI